jgi:dynein heavy chain
VVLFGGCATDEQGEAVPLNDIHLLEVAAPSLVRCGRQEAAGTLPPPRSGALLQEHSDGRLLLYGGSDAAGKPLGDAWLLDVASLTWECLYDAVPEAAGLPAPIAALHGGRLVCLAPTAPGGTRLDSARSIDLLAARESVSFLSRMRPEVAAAAKELEAWVAHQQHGLDLAAAGGDMSTEKLLKVMDALYQCKSRRRATDMQFDQLREACATLQAEHRIKDAAKTEKQLEELRGRWEALKRAVPQVGAQGWAAVGWAAKLPLFDRFCSEAELRCTP